MVNSADVSGTFTRFQHLELLYMVLLCLHCHYRKRQVTVVSKVQCLAQQASIQLRPSLETHTPNVNKYIGHDLHTMIYI